MDKEQTATQAMQKPRLTDIVFESAEWYRLTPKDKIEWIIMDSMSFENRANSTSMMADNIIRNGFDMYRNGGDFDEAMVAVIIAMKKSLDSLYSRVLRDAEISSRHPLFIKP
jgi:hypothetical protein